MVGMSREDSKNNNPEIESNLELAKKYKNVELAFKKDAINKLCSLMKTENLNENNQERTKNFKFFLKNLNKKKYWTDFKVNGSCNYAFPIILKTNSIKKRDNFEKILSKNIIIRLECFYNLVTKRF